MKASLFISLVTFAGFSAAADDSSSLVNELRERDSQKTMAPQVDVKRIINASNSFLKEREPEMTEEEYALYEKVVTMLTSNPEFAVKMLEAMMNEKEPPSPAFEFILGNAYHAVNQPQQSEKYYRSAVMRFPNFVRAWNNLGVLYYTTNRFADAVPCFSKAITLGDREPSTFGLLGFCLEKEGNVVSAEMAYMQALAGAPTNSDWKEGLLRLCIEGKQFGRAESLVRNLIKERPSEKRFWLTHASVLLSLDRKRDAMVVLETAAGIGVAGVDELLLLGDLYADQNLAAEAVVTYEKSLGSARDRGEQKLLRLAQVQIATGKLTEAEQTLASLKTGLTPEGRLSVWQSRADLMIARKRWAEARVEVQALLKVAPLNGQALLTLGRTYAEEHDVPRAILAFEAAYQIEGSTYRASLELAGLELKNRRYAKSVEYLEKALSIQRTEPVEDYLARVRTLLPRGDGSG